MKLAIEGFAENATAVLLPKLDAQFQEMKIGGNGHEIFTAIINSTNIDLERSYQNHLQEIRQAAHRLSIQALPVILQPRAPISVAETPRNLTSKRRRVRAISVPVTIITGFSPSESEAEIATSRSQLQQFTYRAGPAPTIESLPPVPEANFRNELPIPPVAPVLRLNRDSNNNIVPTHPLLLFRATTTINHFRTRKYTTFDSDIPQPPVFNTPEWRDIAVPHLQRDKAYPSPFLSLAQSPKNAINRVEIMNSEEIDKKIFLVIFEFNAVKADADPRFGPDNGPYLVRAMFRDGEISDLPNGYYGTGGTSDYIID